MGEPNAIQWQPDLIEAHIRLGEIDAAEAELARLDDGASRTGGIWAQATAERCHGLLAVDEDFKSHFRRSLSLHTRTPAPFEVARTQLCYGQRLLRSGERRRARIELDQALLTFQRLGAAPWAAQADTELAASGMTNIQVPKQQAGQPIQGLLTPRELQVALAISDGKANREAAGALFLSPKTVEFHLGRIYRKLGINSRTQLARRMLGGDGP